MGYGRHAFAAGTLRLDKTRTTPSGQEQRYYSVVLDKPIALAGSDMLQSEVVVTLGTTFPGSDKKTLLFDGCRVSGELTAVYHKNAPSPEPGRIIGVATLRPLKKAP